MNRFLAILFCFVTVNIASKADEGVTVEPLVKVEWGQYAPYNQFCPQLGDGNAAAGCVAVTMAQAMSVYKSIDINDTTSIAKLIVECGEAAKTNYGQSSTATIGNQVRALVEKYGYDADMTLHNREFATAEEWKSLIEGELQSGRPVMVSATDPDYGGHSFIIDGCRNDSVHINWGWTGEWNGYYSLDNLNPDGYRFTDKQRLVAGFMPDNRSKEREVYWEGVCKLSAVEMSTDNISEITCSIRMLNCLYRKFSGNLLVYVVSPDGTRKRVKYWFLSDYSMDYQYDQTFRFTPPSQPGEYSLLIEMEPLLSSSKIAANVVGDRNITIIPSSTGIENYNVDNRKSHVRKYIKNGRLTIETSKGEYNVIGARL